mmetsp:Transcript_3330/g.7410  ORF Transcript_3330/g.7410 Transcript_3330/m.7410 type:complete len:213 (-) Transcript_3330:1649-2287(-)
MHSLLLILCLSLLSSPYQAYFSETKGVSKRNFATRSFEFVLVDAPRLAEFAEDNPNPHAFAQNTCGSQDACAFPNLGGDATLVVPSQQRQDDLTMYSHLAIFCQKAPISQVMNVWQLAAREYIKSMEEHSDKPVWFSTSEWGSHGCICDWTVVQSIINFKNLRKRNDFCSFCHDRRSSSTTNRRFLFGSARDAIVLDPPPSLPFLCNSSSQL